MAELVDALASGASARMGVEVQVLSRVPNKEDLRGLFCLVSSGMLFASSHNKIAAYCRYF